MPHDLKIGDPVRYANRFLRGLYGAGEVGDIWASNDGVYVTVYWRKGGNQFSGGKQRATIERPMDIEIDRRRQQAKARHASAHA